ncbi:MAG: DM13 domain-containing protein [Woeseiaceae bacterium]
MSLAACGGGGGGGNTTAPSPTPPVPSPPAPPAPPVPPTPPASLSGIFVDSPVGGFRYTTATNDGSTDENGAFSYVDGESVTFSIGDINFSTVAAASVLSPFDLADTDDTSDTALINMARLLQTMDTDGDVDNGITISDDAHAFATGMTLDFASTTFDADVANLIANSGTVNTMLVDANTAIAHLAANVTPGGCTKYHATVGWVADLATFAHGVSGQATIVDDCTIRIDNFNYDGGGLPRVFIYAGFHGNYAGGFRISRNLFGQAFTDETLILKIGELRTLDNLNGISVWCADARVDFGSGRFMPP